MFKKLLTIVLFSSILLLQGCDMEEQKEEVVETYYVDIISKAGCIIWLIDQDGNYNTGGCPPILKGACSIIGCKGEEVLFKIDINVNRSMRIFINEDYSYTITDYNVNLI